MIELVMENGGVIRMELYPDVAPLSVQNFVKLVNEKFYDGIIFHRVVSGFVIQAGDPTGTGFYGSEDTVTGEFASNGIQNDLKHERGVVSMARKSNGYNTASSQFFICLEQCSSLDGDYAAFGRVVEGMDVVDAIATVSVDENQKPLEDQVIKTIRVVD